MSGVNVIIGDVTAEIVDANGDPITEDNKLQAQDKTTHQLLASILAKLESIDSRLSSMEDE